MVDRIKVMRGDRMQICVAAGTGGTSIWAIIRISGCIESFKKAHKKCENDLKNCLKCAEG